MVQKALIIDSSGAKEGSYPVIAEKTTDQLQIINASIWRQVEASSKKGTYGNA